MSNQETPEDREARMQRTRALAEAEQAATACAELYPPLWRRCYLNLLKEGFDEGQAMCVLTAYVHGAGGGKYR